MRRTILYCCCLYLVLDVKAQVNSATSTIKQVKFRLDSLDFCIQKSSRWVLENQFANRVISIGRDYDLKQSGTASQLVYYHKSGFWLSSIGYYLPGTTSKFPKIDIAAGYFTPLDEYLSASFSYNHSLYFNKNDEGASWATLKMLSTNWTIDARIISISPAFYYQIYETSSMAQFSLTASKYIEVQKPFLSGKLIVEPNFTWSIASRDRYYAANPDHPSGKIVRVVSYECVLPITYKKVGVYSFTPRLHWSLPINVLPFDGAEERKDRIYFTANLNVLIWRKR